MLPPDATSRSRELFAIAQTTLHACPPSLYDEAAVTGSVSRGVADDHSDIEINFWVEDLQPVEVYQTWIESLDSTARLHRPPAFWSDDVRHLEYDLNGARQEMIWMRWRDLDAELQPIREGKMPDDVRVPWMIVHAMLFGDTPRLNAYRTWLSEYPADLRQNIIEGVVRIWRRMMPSPEILFAIHPAQRGHLIDLRRRQLMGLSGFVRVLFAYNRVWEPDIKWLQSESKRLTQTPPDLVERCYAILNADGIDSVLKSIDLMHDTLTILAGDFAVDDLLNAVEGVRRQLDDSH